MANPPSTFGQFLRLTRGGVRRILLRECCGLGLALILGAFTGLYAAGAGEDLRLAIKEFVGVVSVGSVAGFFWYRWRRVQLGSYSLMLKTDSITRDQVHIPQLEIRRDEVARIEERSGRGLIVRRQNRSDCISIPLQLDSYEEVRTLLNNWVPIQRRVLSQNILMALALLGALLSTGLFFSTTNKIAVVLLGQMILGFFFWFLMKVHGDSNADPWARTVMWILALFMLLMVVGKMMGVWMGWRFWL